MSFVPVSAPHDCAMQVTLDGSHGATPNVVGPLSLDLAGQSLCLHLDARSNARVHFAASTQQQPGPASSYLATLEDAANHPIRDGWDVSIGQTDTHTFLNLEWGPPAGVTTDVILWVRGVQGSPPTTIALSLFDPLE